MFYNILFMTFRKIEAETTAGFKATESKRAESEMKGSVNGENSVDKKMPEFSSGIIFN